MTLSPTAFKPGPGPLARAFIVGMAALVVLAVVTGAVITFADAAGLGPDVAQQEPAPRHQLTAAAMEEYRAYAADSSIASAPIVLAYHGVETDVSSSRVYSASPQQFADHMAMLAAAGFETLSAAELVDFLETGVAPPRSVVLTFDDGTKSTWTRAEPVLEQYGFNAITFVVTGKVGEHQPYYLTWDEVDRLYRTGRWDIQSHTHTGHVRIAVNTDGDLGPPISNLQWLADEGRFESVDEWHLRATADLDASAATLVEHGYAAPTLLSYPFSGTPSEANDQQVAQLLSAEVASRFVASFSNDPNAGPVMPAQTEAGTIDRLEVFRDTSAHALFDQLAAAQAR